MPSEAEPVDAVAVHDTRDAAIRVVPGPEKVLESARTEIRTLSFLPKFVTVSKEMRVVDGLPGVLTLTSLTRKLTPAGIAMFTVCG